jgi:hypothetical protein
VAARGRQSFTFFQTRCVYALSCSPGGLGLPVVGRGRAFLCQRKSLHRPPKTSHCVQNSFVILASPDNLCDRRRCFPFSLCFILKPIQCFSALGFVCEANSPSSQSLLKPAACAWTLSLAMDASWNHGLGGGQRQALPSSATASFFSSHISWAFGALVSSGAFLARSRPSRAHRRPNSCCALLMQTRTAEAGSAPLTGVRFPVRIRALSGDCFEARCGPTSGGGGSR